MPVQKLIELPPPADLARYVDALWYVRTLEPYTLYLLPTACSELMAYRKGAATGFTLVGPMTVAQTNDVQPGDIYAGVRLKAGTRVRLGQRSAVSLKNARVHGYDLADASVRLLEADVAQLKEPGQIVKRLEQFARELIALQLLTRDPLVDRFIAATAATNGLGDVTTLLTDIPLSPRQFRRRLQAQTGLSPKILLRLYRQQAALQVLSSGGKNISAVAAQHHYTDQAHLTHEFRAHIGLVPRSLGKAFVLHRLHQR